MGSRDAEKWLVLIHQIPPKPNSLRVKIWRRLQQAGAVAIKQSVYVMPHTEQSREDLSWMLKVIVDGGGDGSISEVRFLEGLTDEQILSLFHGARKSDYEKLIHDANSLLSEWSSGTSRPQDPAAKVPAQLSRLKRRLDEIAAIDFFQAPERATAELLLRELGNLLSGQPSTEETTRKGSGSLEGKTWVTRANIFVDRIACAWLIRRFVDQAAVFKFVPNPQYASKPGEVRFDMFDGDFTHEGDRCTFEVMVQRLNLQDHALGPLAEVIHDIDLKDSKYARSETEGFNALLTGLVAAHREDNLRLEEGYRLFDNLYAYYHRQKRGTP